MELFLSRVICLLGTVALAFIVTGLLLYLTDSLGMTGKKK